MGNKWVWFLSAVLIIGITVLTLGYFTTGKALGAGEKLNADGIRDDVAVAIAKTFPESERVRAGAIQLARAFQLAIDDPENALEVVEIYRSAKSCLYAIRGDVRENEKTALGLKVEAMVVNSYARSRAYIKYNGRLSGRIFKSIEPDITKCEFDAASMRN